MVEQQAEDNSLHKNRLRQAPDKDKDQVTEEDSSEEYKYLHIL